jgi:hypothetical protein
MHQKSLALRVYLLLSMAIAADNQLQATDRANHRTLEDRTPGEGTQGQRLL